VLPAPDFADSIQAALAPLPPWRRTLAVVGGVISFAGAAWFKITFSLAGYAISALAVVAGVLLVALAYSGVPEREGTRDAG
jgi:hypothetical protein